MVLAACAIVIAACSPDSQQPESDPPVIQQVLPVRATTAAPVFLIVRGVGFQQGAQVHVGGRAARATWVNGETVTAVLNPPMEAGEFEVRLTNPGGGAASMPAALVLAEPPKPKPTPKPTPDDRPRDEDDHDRGRGNDRKTPDIQVPDLSDLWDILNRLRSWSQ